MSAREEAGRVSWKPAFEREYTELTELARGRFSVVKKCAHVQTGREVAVKFITKKLCNKETVETEYNTLQSLQHAQLIVALDLYETPYNFIIVLEL